jgi:diguanylate cyclase (GGDEF)-like protein/PAS domain S-box-containing protein
MIAHPKNNNQTTLFLVFAVLLLGIGTADYFFYRSQVESVRSQAQQQLAAIADLKVQQIGQWREERLGDAYVLRDNIFVRIAVADWLRLGVDAEQRGQIAHWLQSYVHHFDYREALLLDPQGKVLAATPETLPILDDTQQLLRAAAQSREPELSNLKISIGMDSFMELATPLYTPGNQRLLGFVLLRIAPQRFLFPLLQSWPVPSESAESLLVERRGDQVLYLNELRHRKGTALRLAFPADRVTLPAAAAARGETRVMEGRDYRDEAVLAATRPIPGMPWFLVTKIDMREVRAPLVDHFVFLLAISALALLAALGVTLYLSRLQRQAGWQQEAHARQAAREIARVHDRLVAAQEIGQIGNWERRIGSQTMWCSDETCRLFDLPPDEKSPTLALFYSRVHPEDREHVRSAMIESETQAEQPPLAFRVLLPSGEIRHFQNSTRILRDSAGYPAAIAGTTQDVTGQLRIEQQLRRQSAQLTAVLDNLPIGISVFDETLCLQLWNPGFNEVLGLPVARITAGASFEELVRYRAEHGEYGPGDPEAQTRSRVDLALGFKPHRFENTRSNGRTNLVQGQPYEIDGKLAGFITTYTDITDRKQAELELQRQHTLLNKIIENMPSGVSLADGELNFVAFNHEFFRLLEFPLELMDKKPLSLREVAMINARRGEYGPGDPEQLVDALIEKARQNTPHHFERTRPNGTTIEVRGTPLPDGGFVTTYTDITARKQSEERLLLAEKVFDNSPDAIMITDQNNRIVSTNHAFTLITGYAPGEVLGEDPRLLASGAHDAEFYRKMWAALKHRGQWAGEITDRRKSGETYPKWMTINAVIDQRSDRLTHYVSIFSDITERKSSEERIHYLAHHDALTGLPNRFSLESRLEQACIEARRHQCQLAVLFIDLDRFKVINDTLGHQIGDRLLSEVARRLSATVRESDTVGRLGGDEFVVVLPDMHVPTDAASVAAKIVEALVQPVFIDDHQLHTSPSIGISVYPSDGADADTIMRNADTAMYHAKALGRNNFQFYAEEMNRNAGERLDIENRLRHALSRSEFELHYQPQLATRSMQVVGIEALLRWTPAEGLPVPPARFIPIAEDTGMIVAIGEWVLRTACRQIKTWIDAGIPPLRIAVNVSARQLRKQDFPDQVASALAESGLPAHLLEIEITESAVMEEPEEARRILVKLKAMGVTLAIDDFGTGYSSLAYLKLFPIDNLKIDRSFVTDIGRHADDAAIAISTIALAHSLGLKAIAEGVETGAQHDLLRDHRCDEVQGYLFSRPLAATEALEFLRQAANLADSPPPFAPE